MGDSAVSLWKKYSLFFANFLVFMVTGAAGAFAAYEISTREEKLEIDTFLDFILDESCMILFLASLLFVMSFFGWLGALREYTHSILIFQVILGGLILVELAAIILIFLLTFNEEVRQIAYDEDLYRQAIATYRNEDFESLQRKIDFIQENWECCGVSDNEEGYKDWTYNEYFNCSSEIAASTRSIYYCSVPYSCCIVRGVYQNELCGAGMADPSTDEQTRSATIYTRGCFLAFTKIIEENIMWIGIVCLCILLPQVIGFKIAADLKLQIQIQRMKWAYQPDRELPPRSVL